MKTRKQVETELILDFLADCRTKDSSGLYHAMIERAATMAQQPGFAPRIEEPYVLVPSSTHAGCFYKVNGFCQCPAATHDAKHLCKHYALAKAYRYATGRLENAESAGAIHTHRMLCGHASGHVVCYDSACTDPQEVVCPVCAAGECETPTEAPEDYEMLDGQRLTVEDITREFPEMAQHAPEVLPVPPCVICGSPASQWHDTGSGRISLCATDWQRLGGAPRPTPIDSEPSHQHVCVQCGSLYPCTVTGVGVAHPLACARCVSNALQTTSTDSEPNPAHQHVCSVCGRRYACWLEAPPHAAPWQARCATCVQLPHLSAQPLPEAPASANVYISMNGHKVQITLRGTDESEVLRRMRRVLEAYTDPTEGK